MIHSFRSTMQKFSAFVSVFVLAIVFFGVISRSASAQTDSSVLDPITAETSVVSKVGVPHIFTDANIILSDIYEQPVFVAAGQVQLEGEFHQDVLVAGGSVTINGDLAQDLYVAGGTVVVHGTIQGNVMAAGGEVVFDAGSQVAGSISVMGERVQFLGNANNSVISAAKRTYIAGSIAQDISVWAETLEITDTAKITGNVDAHVMKPVNQSEMAVVAGEIHQEIIEKPELERRDAFAWWFGKYVVTFVGFGIVLSVFVVSFGDSLSEISDKMIEEWQSTVFAGVSLWSALFVGSLLLLITVVGWKASLIGILLLAGLASISWIFPALFLGQWLFSKQRLLVQAWAGAAFTALFVNLPVIGSFLGILFGILGSGALWRHLRSHR